MVFVFVVIFFCEQGDKGDRGPVIRPKVRRFVVMKGDTGPPGIKGKDLIICIQFSNVGLMKETVVILLPVRKVIAAHQVYLEGKVFKRLFDYIFNRFVFTAQDHLDRMVAMASMVRKAK